ncbi:Type 1 glutamine amidotransferase-like domain-containing protein [Priestia endophytica]|uniref:Type 1 glutamine amidotransferase-like domain-containing protein n=1 Tax=Priestia endophytica TaxID=135735 RepID=UPI003D2A096C
MAKLFLSGGGNAKQTEEIDKEFVKQINLNKSLLYIPIAMHGEIPYEYCLEWINSVFNPLGIMEIIMWTDLKNKCLEDLESFSAIYIGGGNTFSLLNNLRNFGFDEVLKDYVEHNGVVYGGSAGAIVLGSNIMTCAHMDSNILKLQDCAGLNLIGNYSIWCHYQVENDHLIRNYMNEYNKPVIALSEETGICLCTDGVRVIGNAPAYVFEIENKRRIEPDTFI